MLKALLTTVLLLVASTCFAQEQIRSSDKPTPTQVKAALDLLQKDKADPNVLAVGGYGFIEVTPGETAYWQVMPGSTGLVDREFVPKGTVVKDWYVAKGDTKFTYQTIPSSDKDRYIVKGILQGQSTLIKIVPGATKDIEPAVSYFHFQMGDVVVVPDKPVPTPDKPIPAPDTPIVEKLGYVTLALTEGNKLPAASRGLATKIADNFEAVGAKLSATAAMTVPEALAELTKRNKETLGAERAVWLPWFLAWQAKTDAMLADGTIATKPDYASAFAETATGLRKVK